MLAGGSDGDYGKYKPKKSRPAFDDDTGKDGMGVVMIRMSLFTPARMVPLPHFLNVSMIHDCSSYQLMAFVKLLEKVRFWDSR
jgi:hypothetical protein